MSVIDAASTTHYFNILMFLTIFISYPGLQILEAEQALI